MTNWEGNENVKMLVCKDGYSHAEVFIIKRPFKTIFIADACSKTNKMTLNFLSPRILFSRSKRRKENLCLKELKDWCEQVIKVRYGKA